MEYYRTTMAFSRLGAQTSSSVSSNFGGGTAPMDISATYKGKSKGKGKGKGKQVKGYKGKGQHKGKGYNNYGYGGYKKGKGKGKNTRETLQEGKGYGKTKGKNKGDNKGKGKHPTNVCYRCGQPGRLAKECGTMVYHLNETRQERRMDGTAYWYEQDSGYDTRWYNNDQAGDYQAYQSQPQQQQQQQQALTAETTAEHTSGIHVVAAMSSNQHTQHLHKHHSPYISEAAGEASIMIDSGAATHVCPTWFAPDTPLYTLEQGQGPQLRTATKTYQFMDTSGYS